MNTVTERSIPVGRRIDGSPWPLRVVEITGTRPGPTTAFVAGMWGDKPLGCLTLHELVATLADDELAGVVVVVPAVNLPALAAGTRVSPDHHQLNRRFPGSPKGFVTDQIAHTLLTTLRDSADCVVDLHSGTPAMALNYTYDFGSLDLSLAFGQLPVVIDHTYPGQLSSVLAAQGIPSCLPEFGGGRFTSSQPGLRGCRNVLKYRGQLDGPLEGPRRISVIRDLQLMLASSEGVLVHAEAAPEVGAAVAPGELGCVRNVVTGEVVERFEVDRPGGLLLMAATSMQIVFPGTYAFMVGFPCDERRLPEAGAGAPS
jgi:predicted deacylase